MLIAYVVKTVCHLALGAYMLRSNIKVRSASAPFVLYGLSCSSITLDYSAIAWTARLPLKTS